MENKDKPKFAELMFLLGEAFDKEPSETKVELFFNALKGLAIDAVSQACSTIVRTRKITGTFPLVSEILEAANGDGNLETRIAVAWDKVLYALENHGHLDSLIFDDPIIHAIIKSWGGWLKWSQEITIEGLKWARKDFAALYKAYIPLPLPAPEPFEGFISQENRNTGYFDLIPAPVYITGQPGAFKSLPYQKEEQRRIEG